MFKNKIAWIAGVAGTIATFAMGAGATLISPPTYTDIVSSTTTAFGSALFTDLLPWAGVLLLITAAGMLLAAIIRRVMGGFGKILGGRRRRRGGRRYR